MRRRRRHDDHARWWRAEHDHSGAGAPPLGGAIEILARREQNKDTAGHDWRTPRSFDFAAAVLDRFHVIVAKEKRLLRRLCAWTWSSPARSLPPKLPTGHRRHRSVLLRRQLARRSPQLLDGARRKMLTSSTTARARSGGRCSPRRRRHHDPSICKGKTVGVKGDLPPSIVALLAKNGLARGTDYDEGVLLDGFDPGDAAPAQVDVLLAGYKSERARPARSARALAWIRCSTLRGRWHPGEAGDLLYIVEGKLAEQHPTVVEDFTRAALKGMEDAIADPEPSAVAALGGPDRFSAGSQNFLTRKARPTGGRRSNT